VSGLPVAFLAFSPQAPGSEGFFETDFGRPTHSWMNVSRPVLSATGDGDNGCNPTGLPGECIGDTPYGRRIPFGRMPRGDKYHLYVHDADTFHELFSLNTDKCAALGVAQGKCDEIARWLESAALAFLDAHLRGDAQALAWLQSNNLELASAGVATWERK